MLPSILNHHESSPSLNSHVSNGGTALATAGVHCLSGLPTSSAFHGTSSSNAKVIDLDGEIQSQVKQGKWGHSSRKKQISINHLLDFQSYTPTSNKSKTKRPHRSKQHHSPDKIHLYRADFINVNYKFIVQSHTDLKPQLLDPNVPVKTDDIMRVIVPVGNSCPICLSDEIIAPRMITSCGHILCLKCLLSLLDSEVPQAKKREGSAIVEKYKECPLCQSIIRRSEILPVVMNNIDARFEIPKVNDDVILSLMVRPLDKIFALPKSMHELHSDIVDFPWFGQQPDLSSYSRILKGNFSDLTQLYDLEKEQILKQFEEEKLLYNEDSRLVSMTIEHINEEVVKWLSKFSGSVSRRNSNETRNHEQFGTNTFYFYQTGFNTNCVYVLSPLDMKVLKTAYTAYECLPPTIVVKIEKIKYEELSEETAATKYKYLSHLPAGTQIGFLECNWYNNEYIDRKTWKLFQEDLSKRTKSSRRKLRKEEEDRKRALVQEEIKSRNFYAQENYDIGEDVIDYATGSMGTLTIIDNRELPPLTADSGSTGDSSEPAGDFQTTIWGTKIPKAEVSPSEDEDFEAEEMIRRAREEMEKLPMKGKKKKKRIVLTSTM